MFQTWSVLCAMLFSCPSRSRDRIWLPCLNLINDGRSISPYLTLYLLGDFCFSILEDGLGTNYYF